MMPSKKQTISFTPYQKFVVFILAITQFTVVLDFMVMSPLGDFLMKSLQINPKQFGIAVSAYALSAGVSGFLTAGFADKFDRKKLLLFFYSGFIIGTFFCGFAPSFQWLVLARIVTGLFGGVMSAISMAIVADLFNLQQRGRVMGFVQMGFGASQVLGIPIGLYLANAWGWQVPFLWIAAMATIIFLLLAYKLKPVNEHLFIKKETTALVHLWRTLLNKTYRKGFLATALLSIGGFMLMPFGSAFAVNNLKITENELPMVFMVAGISTLITMPLIGKLSDHISKLKIYVVASIMMIVLVNIYAHLQATPFWVVNVFNVLIMVFIMGRIVPATTLISAIPHMQDRGAFMSINSSLQQLAGGIAAAFAGTIVVQETTSSPLKHYDTLTFIASIIVLISIVLIYRVSQIVTARGNEFE
jgi:predicted MFS family arabinose efflux permease